jgi:hypothetical protein
MPSSFRQTVHADASSNGGFGDKPIIPYRALPFVAPALALTLPSYTDN